MELYKGRIYIAKKDLVGKRRLLDFHTLSDDELLGEYRYLPYIDGMDCEGIVKTNRNEKVLISNDDYGISKEIFELAKIENLIFYRNGITTFTEAVLEKNFPQIIFPEHCKSWPTRMIFQADAYIYCLISQNHKQLYVEIDNHVLTKEEVMKINSSLTKEKILSKKMEYEDLLKTIDNNLVSKDENESLINKIKILKKDIK